MMRATQTGVLPMLGLCLAWAALGDACPCATLLHPLRRRLPHSGRWQRHRVRLHLSLPGSGAPPVLRCGGWNRTCVPPRVSL